MNHSLKALLQLLAIACGIVSVATILLGYLLFPLVE